MKRIVPLLLSASAGAIGLPILMLASWMVALFLFPCPPRMFMTGSPQEILRNITSPIYISGLLLGAWSAGLLRGERTSLPRLGCALCSGGVIAYFLWMLANTWLDIGAVNSAIRRNVMVYAIAYDLPLILWASGLLLFAVLSRRITHINAQPS